MSFVLGDLLNVAAVKITGHDFAFALLGGDNKHNSGIADAGHLKELFQNSINSFVSGFTDVRAAAVYRGDRQSGRVCNFQSHIIAGCGSGNDVIGIFVIG